MCWEGRRARRDLKRKKNSVIKKLVAVKHPSYPTLQIRGCHPRGATERNAASGGSGNTLERWGWDALGEGPHGNVLYIINNPCLCLWPVTALLLCHMSTGSSWLHLHGESLCISEYLNDAKETLFVTLISGTSKVQIRAGWGEDKGRTDLCCLPLRG